MAGNDQSWHEYFMQIALAIRTRANCKGTRVGAVIALENRIVSTGYNGTPEGVPNCLDGGCYRCNNRDEFVSGTGYDLCICVHAEQNALLSAARFGIAVEGGTLYTTSRPCFGCCKEMLQAKIHAVYYLHDWVPSERSRKQYEDIQRHFPGGVNCMSLPDPEAVWAVPALRAAQKESSADETGHQL